MSTYLVAYVVGEYDYVETKDSNGVSMRVYTPVGKKEHGQFALDVRPETTDEPATPRMLVTLLGLDGSENSSILCGLFQHQISDSQSRSNCYFGFCHGVSTRLNCGREAIEPSLVLFQSDGKLGCK